MTETPELSGRDLEGAAQLARERGDRHGEEHREEDDRPGRAAAAATAEVEQRDRRTRDTMPRAGAKGSAAAAVSDTELPFTGTAPAKSSCGGQVADAGDVERADQRAGTPGVRGRVLKAVECPPLGAADRAAATGRAAHRPADA